MIRVLVVEDSMTVRQALVEILDSDPELRVVGTAGTGEEAVRAALSLKPDVITMDIKMPGMDGFEATRAIMSSVPTPIVIVSGKVDPKDSATLFRMMEAGALMVLPKPAPVGDPAFPDSAARLIRNVKLMSEIKVVRRIPPRADAAPGAAPVRPAPAVSPRVIAIGASAGGPPLLQRILSALEPPFALPILIVQHMTEGFTDNFANWLAQSSRLPVRLAEHGIPMLPGTVYIAPDGHHLEVAGDRISLSSASPENGLRPAVASLFRSVAQQFGSQAAGVLLTGMGRDGAAELKLIRDRGGLTVVQDRESAVVYGMPGEALRLDAAVYVLPPEEIIALLNRLGKEPGHV